MLEAAWHAWRRARLRRPGCARRAVTRVAAAPRPRPGSSVGHSRRRRGCGSGSFARSPYRADCNEASEPRLRAGGGASHSPAANPRHHRGRPSDNAAPPRVRERECKLVFGEHCPHSANTTTAKGLAAEIVTTARVSDHVESLGKERRVVLVYYNDRGDAIVQREAGVSFCEPLESVITDQGWTIEHVIPGARGAAAPGSAPGVRGPIADGRVGSTFIVLSRPKQRAT